MKLRLESRYTTTALLLLSALLLALAIAAEFGWEHRASPQLPQPEPGKTEGAALPPQPEFALPPLEQTYTEVLARPLFVPARRLPPPTLADAPQSSAMRKGQFILLGVILTKDKNIALLREVANGKTLRAEQGKEINGMLLEKLEPEKITLKQGDDYEEVILKIKPMQSQLQQPAPVSTPGAPAQQGATGPAPIASPAASVMQELIARRRAARGLPP